MTTELQKRTAQAIVNIFETGRPLGDYGQVTLLEGDSGHLTYGRSQTTLASGNLYLMLKAYCDMSAAIWRNAFAPYLDRLAAIDLSLDSDQRFLGLLTQAGGDPVMHLVQDSFFDRIFWTPADRDADRLGLTSALSKTVVYDGLVHGSWKTLCDQTTRSCGLPARAGEKEWVIAYIDQRRNWLSGHPNGLLRRTVYRMDELRSLTSNGKWDLPLPLRIRGVEISERILRQEPVLRVSAEDPGIRQLRLRHPAMVGADVRHLQLRLQTQGYALNVDGEFDADLDRIVRDFQALNGLTADGIVRPATRSALNW